MKPEERRRLEALERTVATLLKPQSQFTKLPSNTVYATAGYVAAAGTGNILPFGWSSTKPSTGNYTVTHNLGHTNYVVLTVAVVDGGSWANVGTKTSTTFTVRTVSVLAADADVAFMFFLIPTNGA